MEVQLPSRLFSNERLVTTIGNDVCESCSLLRRSKYIKLPSGELDSAIWSSQDIFGLSINTFLCNTNAIGIESHIEDVRYVSNDTRNLPFDSDNQRASINISEVLAIHDKNIILRMFYGKIFGLSGYYPFGQKGSEEFQEYQYELRIYYKPLLFNPFHFEIQVYSSENDYTSPIERENLKRYHKSLGSDIRNKILLDKLALPL
ncbi:MAG: hypothetical protein WAU36_19760 [Cyclobacteriaceae bacterium]